MFHDYRPFFQMNRIFAVSYTHLPKHGDENSNDQRQHSVHGVQKHMKEHSPNMGTKTCAYLFSGHMLSPFITHMKEHSPNMGTKTIAVFLFIITLSSNERTFPKHGDENLQSAYIRSTLCLYSRERTFLKHGDEN